MLAAELGDQVLHILWGFANITLVWGATGVRRLNRWWVIPTCGLAAAVSMLPRELVDQWPIERSWDTALDLTAMLLGGALAGVLIKEVGRH